MNYKFIAKTAFLFFFLINSANANMRRCMLLPIKDSVGGSLGFKVFEEVELYLKDSTWCYYRSNSEILNILANHKRNLSEYLENPEVLKIVSEKTQAGSLIKVSIINEVNGVDLSVKVFGENGKDLYFTEKTRLTVDDPKVLSQTVINWLNVFEKQIPYDGTITGILGNQFSIDVGTTRSLFEGNELTIIRPVNKKRHPLLKEIIDWETEKLGTAKVIHANQNQSQANVLQYDTTKKMRIGDWVILNESKKVGAIEQSKFLENDEYKFGKLGELSLLFNVGKGSVTAESPTVRKLGGTVLGVDLAGTLWITRNYWFGMDISRVVGSLSPEEGNFTNSTNSMSNSFFKVKGGYKYLPMGFFYGPQIDAYAGYASYTYGLDTSANDGITEVSFSGLLFGVKGSIPIMKTFRAHMELSFIFNPTYSEEANIYGEDDSARNYTLDVGGKYMYAPNMTFDFSYGVNSSKASFVGPVRSISAKQSTFKAGTTFTF